MRVLYLSDNYSEHNRRFVQAIAAAGHAVWFLDLRNTPQPRGWLPVGVSKVDVQRAGPTPATPSDYEAFVPELKLWLQQLHPHVIHAGPVQSCGYVAVLAKAHPLLVMSWGSDLLVDAYKDVESRRITEVALQGADALFCDCEAVRASARDFADLPDSRVVQFPWGIKRGTFSSAGPLLASTAFTREPGAKILISTRAWEPVYGIAVLLEAFWLAYSQNRALRLLMLGSGSEAPLIREFIKQHHLQGVIFPVGLIRNEELPMWFRVADAYVSCARSDGTSVSLLEAMATGLPVIVTDIPSNREWVTEGDNGWLAEANVPEAFAGHMLRAAKLSSQERAEIGWRNEQVVTARADWDKNFPRLLQMYDCLVRSPAKSEP